MRVTNSARPWTNAESHAPKELSADIGAYELIPCDFDGDGDCDIDDLDLLIGEIASGNNNAFFDLTGDSVVDLADRDQWLADAGAMNLQSMNPYLVADANLTASSMAKTSSFGMTTSSWQPVSGHRVIGMRTASRTVKISSRGTTTNSRVAIVLDFSTAFSRTWHWKVHGRSAIPNPCQRGCHRLLRMRKCGPPLRTTNKTEVDHVAIQGLCRPS